MDPLKASTVALSNELSTRRELSEPRNERVNNFATTYRFAQMAAELSKESGANKTGEVKSSAKTFPITSPFTQNLKISNAAASITGSEPGIHERALALRAYRQELLASNIANADTPNYKAVDIDIKEALRNNTPISQVAVKYSVNPQAAVDGNTVDMDAERVKFMENSLMYEFAVDKVKGKYKSMMDLLQNLPY